MAVYEPKALRNVALIGHGGDGKTTLAEAMLFANGSIDRMGRVDDGTATMDFDPEETKRHISISAALAPVELKDAKINLIDVPGYFDFVGEMYQALRVADSALIVLSAVGGVLVGTEKAFAVAGKANIGRMLYVSQMDRENANYDKCVEQLREKFGTKVIPVMLPVMDGMKMKGYIDIVTKKAFEFSGKTVKDMDIPASLMGAVDTWHDALVESAAENDEALLEKFFGGEELTLDELTDGLKKGILAGSTIPVMGGSAVQAWGINELIANIVKYMPSPADLPAAKGTNPKNDQAEERACNASEPFSAIVFKTVADPFVGKLSVFKVLSGKLTSDMVLFNPNAEKQEKTGSIYLMKGKKQTTVESISAGDIGALAKLQFTATGHTLCVADHPIQYPTIAVPKPSVSMAVSPKVQGEEDKVFSGLHRLEEEDLTFTVSKQADTGEMVISGIGELQLEVVTKKLKNKFNADVVLTEPRLAYRETIRKAVKAEGKHKKQSGGHGQYGHCVVEFEPIKDGTTDFEFVDKIVGGVVPRNFIPAVEKGLRESIVKGVLAGYPVVGLRAKLVFGSYHPVDSSEMAFKIAAHLAFKQGCKEASPVLLEPIYRAEVLVPDEYTGDIIGDFNRRRGRILGMEPDESGQKIIAEVPMAEMFKYATDLRSMTQARGSFELFYERYDEVPSNIATKIIENAVHEKEEEE